MLRNSIIVIPLGGFVGCTVGISGGVFCGGLVARPGGIRHSRYMTFRDIEKSRHLARIGTQSIFCLDPKNGNLLLSNECHTQSNFFHTLQTIIHQDMYQTKSTSEAFS